MIIAYKHYDESMGVKFTTYAYPYILGEMKKLVREDKSIKISRSIQFVNLKIEKARVILTQRLMRDPSINELSDFLELPEEMICEAINSTKTIYSIDEPINNDGKELTLKDTIGKIDNPYLDELIQLRDEISMLSPFEKQIIERDEFDKNKTIAPFVIPKGALIIDSSYLNIEETIAEIKRQIELVRK